MINYFIFNYSKHNHFIDSFLVSASLAHKQEKKSTDWFKWKFRDNPFGQTILACAEEDGEIVGCVGYGLQEFYLNGKLVKGSLAFENFVHPKYQRKGVFKKLIALLEKEISKKRVDFLLVFPNTNSLPGYVRMNWSKLTSPEYRIKGNKTFKLLFSLKELKKGFIPNESNLMELNMFKDFKQSSIDGFYSVISTEYLNWRFFTYPVSEYVVINNENYQSIIRMGKRGNLLEGQVLFLNITDEKAFRMSDFMKKCKEKINYDLISFSITQSNPIHKRLKRSMFIKVPNKTNICFKIINHNAITDEDMKNISLSAINYHTY
jgi:GNAT superfamily N-acetyltransferase